MIKQLKPCFDTWDHQDKEGFVFISHRGEDVEWADKTFKWPDQKEEIDSFVKEKMAEDGTDLYWCPLIFSKRQRREENVVSTKVLFADLDPIDPSSIELEPTVAWESSPSRYQALWWLENEMEPEILKEYNRRLTYLIGADKGGWDLTQVLRIPGTYNYKYETPQKGKLLWNKGDQIYTKKDIFNLPEVDDISQSSTHTDLIELLSRYRKLIPKKISRMLQYPDSRVSVGNRSDILWYIESDLVSRNIPIEDIIALIQASPWNKYKGRKDEWKRLTTEITKVHEEYLRSQQPGKQPSMNLREPSTNTTQTGTLTSVIVDDLNETKDILKWTSFEQLMASQGSQPGWLIKDIWLKRSHGIVAGEPKTFKSTVALDIAVSVASGKPLWGKFEVEETGPVMVIQNENAEWIIKDRLEKIIASKNLIGKVKSDPLSIVFPPDLPITFLNNCGYNFSDPLHCQMVEDKIRAIKPKLIIFDPLYLMFDGEINSAKDLQPILFWLLEVRNKYHTAVMVIHHWNKNGASSRGGQRMLGSTTLHGWVESGLYIQSKMGDSKDASVVIEREFRAAGILPKLDLSIKMGEYGDPNYEVTASDSTTGSTSTGELIDFLSMHPGGLSLSQLALNLEVSRRKLMPMLKEVEDEVSVEKGPRGSIIVKLRGGSGSGARTETTEVAVNMQ